MFDINSNERVRFMSSTAEASHLVRTIGGNADSKKERRLRAWRKLSANFSWNRIVDLDRGALHARVSADELNLLRRAAAQQKQEANEIEERNDFREIRERIGRLEALLLSTDAEFHRETLAALRLPPD